MKLMILNTTLSADNDFFKQLAAQAGIEVVTVASKDIDIVKSARTPQGSLQAFQSLLDGKQLTNQEIDDADWSQIDKLAHNQAIDSNNTVKADVNWKTIDTLEHNKDFDSNQ